VAGSVGLSDIAGEPLVGDVGVVLERACGLDCVDVPSLVGSGERVRQLGAPYGWLEHRCEVDVVRGAAIVIVRKVARDQQLSLAEHGLGAVIEGPGDVITVAVGHRNVLGLGGIVSGLIRSIRIHNRRIILRFHVGNRSTSEAARGDRCREGIRGRGPCFALARRVPGVAPVRADARRNRDRLLDAATEVILEAGAEPPLDAIARRAGVGIGTLYRHFPDRQRMLHAVAEHALDQSINAAEAALTAGLDGYDALREYLHDAIDIGVGVLNLVTPLLDGPDWIEQRARMTALLEAIVKQGKRDGRLRDETKIVDIVFAVIRYSRPLAIGLPRADERALAHRHLDIYVDGLGALGPPAQPLPEPSVLERWPS
jgi:AcrR family transcriptional regulator